MRWIHAPLIALSGVAVAGPGLAADLPVKAPMMAPVAALYDWSGFYIGANAGGGWSNQCWTFVDTVPPGSVSAGKLDGCYDGSGWAGGGQIGYNWQRGAFVFGFELSGDAANINGTHNSPITATLDLIPTKIDALGLLTGRIGWANNNFLLYARGGAALVNDSYQRAFGVPAFGFPAGTVFASASETRTGWTVGAGFEYGFTPNWSAGIEYDYAGLGTNRVSFTTNAVGLGLGFAPGFLQDIKQSLQLVTVRVNYRFGGPVIARY